MRLVAALSACLLASAALIAQTDTTVYTAGAGVTLPSVIRQVRPEYTRDAMDQRIQGNVTLECVIRPDARITDIKVVKSLDAVHGLDKKAVEALQQWVFKPGTKGDKPVAVRINVEMTFTLK